MITFGTETGSVYEVDGARMRRAAGNHPPTANQRADGEWRCFTSLSPVEVGLPVTVVWGAEETEDGMVLRRTQTTRVGWVERTGEDERRNDHDRSGDGPAAPPVRFADGDGSGG